jgi:thiamine-monophosphate kinase
MDGEEKTIEDMGEFGFIRSIMKDCLHSPEEVIQGIGDDCAVVDLHGGKVLLFTTDLLMEDRHFLKEKTSPFELGWKAIAVNLSDIAAMGGRARHAFVSLAIPSHTKAVFLSGLYDGMKEMCRRYGVNLLGGDTSSSPGGLFINVAVMGEMAAEEVLYRKGASPGDLIYVTGSLGGSAAGLKLLTGELSCSEEIGNVLVALHNRPEPRLAAGRLIAESRTASAMIDVSDGLLADLRHICEAGHGGARIFMEDLPVSGELASLCRGQGMDPRELALHGGEDYELLFTVPRKNRQIIEGMMEDRRACSFTLIGEMTKGKGLRVVIGDGTEEERTGKGFDHFRPSD